MQQKRIYRDEVAEHIESLYELIEHHDRHLESTESVSKESHEKALHELKQKRRHLDSLLGELEEAGEHAWQHLREKIDAGIKDLRSALERARQHL